MKKNISKRRRLFGEGRNRRLGLFGSRNLQLADARTKAALEKWIDTRGYADSRADMGTVAEQLGVSSLQLSYYFRVIVGKTFLAWRKEIRIREAQELLIRYPERSVASIGEAVGITDKSNFRRQFVEVTGMTPIAYRESQLSGSKKQ